MLKNRNMAVVSRMAKRTLKEHSSLTMLAGVFIAAFLMFGVLTVGLTYFKMEQIYNIRMDGADHNAVLYGVTKEQMKLCEEHPDVRYTGVCGIAGYVEEAGKDQTLDLGLIWADKEYWEEMSAPARQWMQGSYPVGEDEVLVTKKALKTCGYESLGVGDMIPMTCMTPGGTVKKNFRISGIFKGYGLQSLIYVSEAFFQQHGGDVTDSACGRYYIAFRQFYMSSKEQQEFTDSLQLSKKQTLYFSTDYGKRLQVFMGAVCLVLAVCLCAFLLIYNIMCITVSGRVRYYGLLQTIGMTGRQIRGMLGRQLCLIGIVGTAGGIGSGCLVSFFLIPWAVQALGHYTGRMGDIDVIFHPAVFLLTAVFISLTLYAAGCRPAKIAAGIQPLEALGYRPSVCGRNYKRNQKSPFMLRMAWGQIVKDKKKSAVIVLSSAAVLSVFLCITVLLNDSLRANGECYLDFDLLVKNDTLRSGKIKKHKQILDDRLLEKIEKIPGVKEIHTRIAADIIVPWEPGLADTWMREIYDIWMNVPYEDKGRIKYQKHPEKFPSVLAGIDQEEFAYLNQTLPVPVDEERFQKGEICILYRNGTGFTDSELTGRRITLKNYADGADSPSITASEKTADSFSFEIAGITDAHEFVTMPAYAPLIIVSRQTVEAYAEESYTVHAGIYFEQEYDRQTQESVMEILADSPDERDFSYESKIWLTDSIKEAQGPLRGMGMGIAGILSLIGILNYVNTMVGNIRSRRVEFSVMESIGMTGRQLVCMLALEGFLYAAAGMVLTMTAGVGMAYVLHRMMAYYGMEFILPAALLSGAAALNGIICMAVPAVIYRAGAGSRTLEFLQSP